MTPLGALSFQLHKQLAAQHDGAKRWGYAPSIATSLTVGGGAASEEAVGGSGEDWLFEGGSRVLAAGEALEQGEGPEWVAAGGERGNQLEVMGEKGNTAQL